MRNRVLVIAAAALLLLPFATASAQDAVVVAQVRAEPSNVLSIQPFNAVLLNAFSGEYERRTGTALTFGIGGTYWKVPDTGDDDLTYTSGDVKLRYYPQGTALQGFSFGGTVGFSQISETIGTDDTSESGPSFGILLEYQWLMGASRNFAVALGIGAKAVVVDEDTIGSEDFTARYPTARISVGFAF